MVGPWTYMYVPIHSRKNIDDRWVRKTLLVRPVALRTSCVFVRTTSRFPFRNGCTSLQTNQVVFICSGVPRWLSLFPNPNYSLCVRIYLILFGIFWQELYQDTEQTVINPSSWFIILWRYALFCYYTNDIHCYESILHKHKYIYLL